MVSLLVLVGLLVATLFATAWAVAFAARLAGSPRGRLRTGLLAVLQVMAAMLVLAGIQQLMSARGPAAILASALCMLLLQLGTLFLILCRAFSLSAGRTFAPLGAYLAATLASVAFAAFVLKPRLAEAFIMPTNSMSPTINPADRFMVNKVLTPRRWDLVAYRSTDRERSVYCKRLVGLPGDRLRFENGQLYVNDQPVTAPAPLAGRLRTALPVPTPTRYTDGQSIPLGPDEFFFVGDNIDISGDSRIYGPSSRSDLVGVVDLVYWPLAKARVVR